MLHVYEVLDSRAIQAVYPSEQLKLYWQNVIRYVSHLFRIECPTGQSREELLWCIVHMWWQHQSCLGTSRWLVVMPMMTYNLLNRFSITTILMLIPIGCSCACALQVPSAPQSQLREQPVPCASYDSYPRILWMWPHHWRCPCKQQPHNHGSVLLPMPPRRCWQCAATERSKSCHSQRLSGAHHYFFWSTCYSQACQLQVKKVWLCWEKRNLQTWCA